MPPTHVANVPGPTRALALGPAKWLGPVLQGMLSIPLEPSWRRLAVCLPLEAHPGGVFAAGGPSVVTCVHSG